MSLPQGDTVTGLAVQPSRAPPGGAPGAGGGRGAPRRAPALAFRPGAGPRVGSDNPTAPTQVVLHFTQAIEPAFSRIEVQDGTGNSVVAGDAHTIPGDPTRFAIGLAAIGAGTYTVIWHVTSVDTHKTQGKFHFTVVH